MSAEDARAKSLIDRFLAWWRASVRNGGRLGTLDAGEVDSMAREFGLSGDALIALEQSGGSASELLHRMMRANGLSYEDLRRIHPDVVRGLEIHCSLCSEKRRCRRELDAGDAPEGFTEYCPNAPTFVELQAEALQRLV